MPSKIVVISAAILDLIAFALSIAAELHRSKAKVATDSEKKFWYCVYDSQLATGFGAGALVSLLAAQIIVASATRCFCCGPSHRPGGKRNFALTFFMLSWLMFVVAELCLLVGTVGNGYHTWNQTLYFENQPTCRALRRGVFGAGAVFALLTGILLEIFYACYDKMHYTPIAEVALGPKD